MGRVAFVPPGRGSDDVSAGVAASWRVAGTEAGVVGLLMTAEAPAGARGGEEDSAGATSAIRGCGQGSATWSVGGFHIGGGGGGRGAAPAARLVMTSAVGGAGASGTGVAVDVFRLSWLTSSASFASFRELGAGGRGGPGSAGGEVPSFRCCRTVGSLENCSARPTCGGLGGRSVSSSCGEGERAGGAGGEHERAGDATGGS